MLLSLRLLMRERIRRWLGVCLLLLAGAVQAEPASVEVSQMRLERTDDGIFLSTSLKFELPAVVEEALRKGIPMFFVAEAVVYRDRWYWTDKQIVAAARHMRLSYQPLTGRWRLSISPTAIGNSGLALGQTFDTREDAIGAIQRISRWKIAESGDIEADARHNVDFKFRLDISQLPRPFQIGAVGQADWSLSATRNQRLAIESGK